MVLRKLYMEIDVELLHKMHTKIIKKMKIRMLMLNDPHPNLQFNDPLTLQIKYQKMEERLLINT